MPQFADVRTLNNRRARGGADRAPTRLFRIIEEGGQVLDKKAGFYGLPAFIKGVVLDSLGRPQSGVRISLGGSSVTALSDSAGQFNIDSLAEGPQTIIASMPSFDILGMYAGDVLIPNIREGDTARVTLRTRTTEQVLARLCEFSERPRGDRHELGTLRILFRDQETGRPLPNVPVYAFWLGKPVGARGNSLPSGRIRFSGERGGLQGLTDAAGTFNFCFVPIDTPLFLEVLLPDLQQGPVAATCWLNRSGITMKMVRTVMPKAAAPAFSPDTAAQVPPCDSVAATVQPATIERAETSTLIHSFKAIPADASRRAFVAGTFAAAIRPTRRRNNRADSPQGRLARTR
jgi:hypothetical protein